MDMFRMRVKKELKKANGRHAYKTRKVRGGADDNPALKASVLNGKLVVTSNDAERQANAATANTSYSLRDTMALQTKIQADSQQKKVDKTEAQIQHMASRIPGTYMTYGEMAEEHNRDEDARVEANKQERRRKFLENEPGGDKFLRGLLGVGTAVADAAVTYIPGISNTFIGDAYKSFAPPGSQYYSEGSLGNKFKGFAGQAVQKRVKKAIGGGEDEEADDALKKQALRQVMNHWYTGDMQNKTAAYAELATEKEKVQKEIDDLKKALRGARGAEPGVSIANPNPRLAKEIDKRLDVEYRKLTKLQRKRYALPAHFTEGARMTSADKEMRSYLPPEMQRR